MVIPAKQAIGFWQRIIQANARVIRDLLRHTADVLEDGLADSPALAYILFYPPTEREISMGEITLQDDSAPLAASVRFLDSKGAETQPDDVPQWSSSDEAVASVEGSEDGLSATVTIGTPGAAVIEVRSTEANTGVEVIAQGTVTVQPGDTAIGEVTFTESETEA